MNSIKEQIARDLLDIGAVFLRPREPFLWASGIKSPIYCDNRLILSAPEARARVENAIADMVRREYPGCQALMGTATAGIAHAAIAAHILGVPMGYVRVDTKDHGRENKIEGKVWPGCRIVIVEDLISTAGSAVKTAAALREAGAEVMGIASIFTYDMSDAAARLTAEKLRNASLTDFDTLVEIAAACGYIKQEDKGKLLAFRAYPADESWMEKE